VRRACVACIFLAAISFAWSGEIRYIYLLKGKATIAYFQDDEPGSIVWVYSTQKNGAVGYFQKGQPGDIIYIYRYGGESPLFFTDEKSGPIYIYEFGNPGIWGYFNK
jgi:hypothetical protein